MMKNRQSPERSNKRDMRNRISFGRDPRIPTMRFMSFFHPAGGAARASSRRPGFANGPTRATIEPDAAVSPVVAAEPGRRSGVWRETARLATVRIAIARRYAKRDRSRQSSHDRPRPLLQATLHGMARRLQKNSV